MPQLRSVEEWCAQQGLTAAELAARAGLEVRRVRAILAGQWTPSPVERDKVAGVLGVSRDEIAWGHRTVVSHIHGHGPQFGRSP
jgi:transcriptional regulator with XRE-family HTH domain